MTVSREQSSGEPKREHAQSEQATPATLAAESTVGAPAAEPVQTRGQGRREGRSAGAVVGLSGSMRARDVGRTSVTPRHES